MKHEIRHDCIKEHCKPYAIVEKLCANLATLNLRDCSKSFMQLHLHQDSIQTQIISHSNYILFIKVAEYTDLLLEDSPIIKILLEIAEKSANLKWMLHANGDAAFKKAIECKHYKTASVILHAVKELQDNGKGGDMQHFNSQNFQLVMKNEVLKMIASLSDPSRLVFTIKVYDNDMIKDYNTLKGYCMIKDYNVSISEGHENEENNPSLIKRLKAAASTFSLNTLQTSPMMFKISKINNEPDKIELSIFNDGLTPTIFRVPMNDTSVVEPSCFGILSWCSNHFPLPVSVTGNIAEDVV
ncbi:hypothetical protein [Candidatus Tisiphia endosymbiont of Nemotelus uliginosus]|uniref:hypothetical protein n=1 Tax=Candidatus Tisiphia endosymbiont of Nemotelus uliginosus TaxID=3077926 RepID=UPI0035C8DBF0